MITSDLRKTKDDLVKRLAGLARTDPLDVDQAVKVAVEKPAVEAALTEVDKRLAEATRLELQAATAAREAEESAAITTATATALAAFVEFYKAVTALATVYRIRAVGVPVVAWHLVQLARPVTVAMETLRGLGVDGLPARPADPAPARPRPPKPKIDTSAHYTTYPAFGPDSPGRQGAQDPTLFNPAYGRPMQR
jgi:hypothetical protein